MYWYLPFLYPVIQLCPVTITPPHHAPLPAPHSPPDDVGVRSPPDPRHRLWRPLGHVSARARRRSSPAGALIFFAAHPGLARARHSPLRHVSARARQSTLAPAGARFRQSPLPLIASWRAPFSRGAPRACPGPATARCYTFPPAGARFPPEAAAALSQLGHIPQLARTFFSRRTQGLLEPATARCDTFPAGARQSTLASAAARLLSCCRQTLPGDVGARHRSLGHVLRLNLPPSLVPCWCAQFSPRGLGAPVLV